MEKKSVIRAEELHVHYSDFKALNNITFEIPSNSITALIGASGSGKSTFLHSLNRMLDVIPNARTRGKIIVGEKNILDENTDIIDLRKKIGMVFQNPVPFPKSIYDNVAYGLEVSRIKNKRASLLSRLFNRKIDASEVENSNDTVDQIVTKSLKEANLWKEVKNRLHHSALGLSGGQQQRLCIARAIAVKPEILLLDEPCSGLDPISTKKIEELLINLKHNYTIVIVTHNMHQARRISDYVGFFHSGELIEFGETRDMFEYPQKLLTHDYLKGNFG